MGTRAGKGCLKPCVPRADHVDVYGASLVLLSAPAREAAVLGGSSRRGGYRTTPAHTDTDRQTDRHARTDRHTRMDERERERD